jgi:hypothetical protein
MKTKTPLVNAVAKMKSDCDEAKQKVADMLELRGWQYSSSNPLCRWLWSKVIDGNRVMCNFETAVEFETRICGEEYPEPN